MQSSIGHYSLQTGIKKKFPWYPDEWHSKQLTKETSDEVVAKKQSKNNSVGMKNSKMPGEIKRLLDEMTQNS